MDRDRILAIEDDAGVSRLLRHSLAREDFDLRIVASGKEGLAATRATPPDLVLLDLGLPDIDGLEVCRQLKSDPHTRHLPVVILTGKGEESDIVSGLEMGADDYIIKPFRPRILNARIRAVLRRRLDGKSSDVSREEFQVGALSICPQREVVRLDQTEFDLSPPEFHFLHALTRALAADDGENRDEPSIGQEGMALYADNRLDRLQPILKELLQVYSDSNPLLCKYAGLALIPAEPETGERLLYRAAELFAASGQPVAELSVLAHLILFHIFYDGEVAKAIGLFQKSEMLAQAHFDQLSVFSRIIVAQAQAVGHALIASNFSRAYEYLSVAEALAEDRGLVNFRVINLLVGAYEAYLAAEPNRLAGVINETLQLLAHPQISVINKALLKLPQLVYISLTGHFDYFSSLEPALRNEFASLFPAASFPSCLLSSLQCQAALNSGNFELVKTLQTETGTNPIYRTSMTGMLAMSAALNGQTTVAEEALATFSTYEQPVSFVDMIGRLHAIRAQLALGQQVEAAKHLEQLQTGPNIGRWKLIDIYMLALSLVIHPGRPFTSNDLATLQTLLSEIRASGIQHLRCLTRDDLKLLISTAVNQNIDRTFAVDLGHALLEIDWNRDWQPMPMLRFKTLGMLQLTCNELPGLRLDDFSRSQRECLALLIAAPKNRIDQEEMQLAFWPESSPEKARANLDTMLSRLRKTIQSQIRPLATKNYLKLQKGVISLEHCRFDTEDLLAEIERGRNYLRNREFWKADIALTQALSRWQGEYIPGTGSQTSEYSGQLRQACLKITLRWCDVLNDFGLTDRATDLLQRTLNLDRCNEELVSQLYRSYMRGRNITGAGQLLKQFEEALKNENYPPQEIVRLLTGIRSCGSN